MIKVGIIGFGDGGQSNAKALQLLGDEVAIVAVSDCDDGKRKTVEEICGDSILFSPHYQAMICEEDVDLIIVATPDNEHLTPTKDVIHEAIRYVFVEKPVATTFKDLAEFQLLVRRHPGTILFSEKYSFAYPVQGALALQDELGEFMTGSTTYTMWNCDRIMGGGRWRTEHAYNPCAGGLSHNFMTALLFAKSPIVRVRATGQVLTYHENLDKYGGFDAMEGTLEFKNGKRMQWIVCLAVQGVSSPFAHRTVTHMMQFRRGSLVYGPLPEHDKLIVEGQFTVSFPSEPQLYDPADIEKKRNLWAEYNVGVLYKSMYENILESIKKGTLSLHTIEHGINVAAACISAFQSAQNDGAWMGIDEEFQF